MSRITYKNLYTQIVDEIESRTRFNTSSSYGDQLERVSVAPVTDSGRYDVSTAELVRAIQNTLEDALPSWIISGLEVTATDPISGSVTVSSGKGAAGGNLYELADDVTIQVSFDDSTYLFYVVLYKDSVLIEKTYSPNKLTLAKIVVPQPGTTNRVKDNKGDDFPWDAYIVNFREYKLYGRNDKFEEDTQELIKDNIGDILADTLIGTLKLSENLKITNTQGTLELDSESLKLYDSSEDLLAEFNRNGTFYYDSNNTVIAKFGRDEAFVGNILITKNTIQSRNFVTGSTGFKILDDGSVEFSDGTFRGTLSAPIGTIGGWTIASDSLYATTTGTIKTSSSVGVGSDGVIIDKDGMRMYDSVLGLVVEFPSDGSVPTFASGTINETTFEISTNAVLRTASTVGDGSASSAGILINNTGIYGCEANQLLANANLKALVNGDIRLEGEILADSGTIGTTIITSTQLTGGLIVGSTIRSPIIETSDSLPKIRIDNTGLYYQVTGTSAKYGASGSGLYGFKYGDGTNYGAGVLAYLFNINFPVFSVVSATNLADVRLYNRAADPTAGTHQIGDLICVSGKLKICTAGGTPGTFTVVGAQVA